MTTFAYRVRERRVSLGMTQGEVAKISGLKQPDVSKIELGRIQQTTEILGLAKALKCNPEWLATGEGMMDLASNQPLAPVEYAQAATKTIASSLEVLARVLRTVPEPERDAVSRKLASLAMAPDSAQLLQSLQIALQPARPPTESKDIYPAVPSLFTKNKATQ